MTDLHTELYGGDLPLSEKELQEISRQIPVITYSKGTILLREGQIAREAYFVLKGCIRAYYLVDGEERTSEFYTENQSAAALESYTRQIPASHFLECLEDSTLSVLTWLKEQELVRIYPAFGSICRNSMQANFGQTQKWLSTFVTLSAEERYLLILETRPELLVRVPQYHLASYLGIKPESLSRIRKRLSKKTRTK